MRLPPALAILLAALPGHAQEPDWLRGWTLGLAQTPLVHEDARGQGALLGYSFLRRPIDDKLSFQLDAIATAWRFLPDPGAGIPSGRTRLASLTLAPTLRAYFTTEGRVRPYLQAAAGPTRLSNRAWGDLDQGSPWTFQDTFTFGMELGPRNRGLDVGWRYLHVSNLGLAKPNQNIDLPYVITVGWRR